MLRSEVSTPPNVPCRRMKRAAFRDPWWRKPIKMVSPPAKSIDSPDTDQVSTGPYTAESYSRRADHVANTTREEETSYVLTLHTDPDHHKCVTALRTQYFPQRLNKLSAHIALFRALPGSQLATIETDISALAEKQRSFPVATGKAFLLSHGVAIDANAPPAQGIYEGLRQNWEGFLSKQDKSFKAHYTIQNKAEDGVPERTLEELERNFKGSKGQVDGLSLYRYDRGYWRHMKDFMFPQSTNS